MLKFKIGIQELEEDLEEGEKREDEKSLRLDFNLNCHCLTSGS